MLTKQFTTMNSVKVNAVGTQGRAYISYDLDMNEDAKYLDRDLEGFRAKGQSSA